MFPPAAKAAPGFPKEPTSMPQEVAPATRSTVFDFEHKVFKIAGGRFALSRTNGLPVYYVPLGELEATLPLENLCAEFAIRDESPDALLLGVIERSLHHVKEIRSGDSIPRELLDGTASWSVEERHRAIAHGRIASNILCWL